MKEKKHPRLPFPVRLFILIIAAVLIIYLLMIGYVYLCERSVPATVPSADHYDAIIVLGAQVYPDGTPSVQLSWRLDAACDAYYQKPVPIVVCGARGKDEPMTEAEAMKHYLIGKNIPETDIMTDPESFTTKQNLRNAAALLENISGISQVLIVTSDYHVPRSLALARDIGFDACGMGSPCKPEYWIKNHAREALAWCKYLAVKYFHLPLE